jgi:hypothetical protein
MARAMTVPRQSRGEGMVRTTTIPRQSRGEGLGDDDDSTKTESR